MDVSRGCGLVVARTARSFRTGRDESIDQVVGSVEGDGQAPRSLDRAVQPVEILGREHPNDECLHEGKCAATPFRGLRARRSRLYAPAG